MEADDWIIDTLWWIIGDEVIIMAETDSDVSSINSAMTLARISMGNRLKLNGQGRDWLIDTIGSEVAIWNGFSGIWNESMKRLKEWVESSGMSARNATRSPEGNAPEIPPGPEFPRPQPPEAVGGFFFLSFFLIVKIMIRWWWWWWWWFLNLVSAGMNAPGILLRILEDSKRFWKIPVWKDSGNSGKILERFGKEILEDSGRWWDPWRQGFLWRMLGMIPAIRWNGKESQ